MLNQATSPKQVLRPSFFASEVVDQWIQVTGICNLWIEALVELIISLSSRSANV